MVTLTATPWLDVPVDRYEVLVVLSLDDQKESDSSDSVYSKV